MGNWDVTTWSPDGTRFAFVAYPIDSIPETKTRGE
jgi:Tol biopolymer transport system component